MTWLASTCARSRPTQSVNAASEGAKSERLERRPKLHWEGKQAVPSPLLQPARFALRQWMLVAPVVIAWPMMTIFWCRLTRCSPIGKQEACADCCNIMYVGWRHQRACLDSHEPLPPLLASSTHPALSALYIFFWRSPLLPRWFLEGFLLFFTFVVCSLGLWDKFQNEILPNRGSTFNSQIYFYWRGKGTLKGATSCLFILMYGVEKIILRSMSAF